jgi:hypothetical protein
MKLFTVILSCGHTRKVSPMSTEIVNLMNGYRLPTKCSKCKKEVTVVDYSE